MWTGHLHYKLAVIKPLLTVMGCFQGEVMPATDDNTGDGHRGRPAAITPVLRSVTVQAPTLIEKSIFQHSRVHFPVTNARSPLICYKQKRPKGSAPSPKGCLWKLLCERPNEGGHHVSVPGCLCT